MTSTTVDAGRRAGRMSILLHLSWQIFLRDFRARYRRAYFAPFWILAPMLVMSASAALIARELAPSLLAGPAPYPVLVVAGLLFWGVFSDSVTGPQQMCRRSRTYLRRAPIEPGAILIASTCYVVMNLLVRVPVLVGLMIWFGFAPPPQALLAPLFLVSLGMLGLGLGAMLAPLSLVYLDIRYGLPFVLMVALLLTPVFYPVPETGTLRTLAEFNPIAHLLVCARDLLTLGRSDFLGMAAATAAATSVLFTPLAIAYYRWGLPKGIAHI